MNKVWIAAGGLVALVAISAIGALTGGDSDTPSQSTSVEATEIFKQVRQDEAAAAKHKAIAQHRRETRRQVQREIAEEQAEIAARKAQTSPVAGKVEKAERLNREDAEAQQVENEACHDGAVGELHCEEREEAERVAQICSLSEDEAASYGSEALEVWYATCD